MKEIERKYLCKFKDIPVEAFQNSKYITQSYFCDNPAIRIRIIKDKDNKIITSKLTIKGSGTIEREEIEFDIPIDKAREAIKLSKYKTIEKQRLLYNVNNNLWEIDVFGGDLKGLVIAEIELKSIDQKFIKPKWLNNSVDVSEIKEYSNVSLAMKGIANERFG